MDGGMSHGTDRKTQQSSLRVKENLKNMLRQNLPNTKVEDYPACDIDSDFFLCASSPMLVTAGGSFAICSAIANNGKVRTPACKNTNFCNLGDIPVQEIRPGWITYKYSKYQYSDDE